MITAFYKHSAGAKRIWRNINPGVRSAFLSSDSLTTDSPVLYIIIKNRLNDDVNLGLIHAVRGDQEMPCLLSGLEQQKLLLQGGST